MGPNVIPVEIIQLIDEETPDTLVNPFNNVYLTGIIPRQWVLSMFITGLIAMQYIQLFF